MLRKRRTWLVLIALTGVALAVYFEPSHCVRGWLLGEAFYDGRPTSFWRGSIKQWIDEFPSQEEAVRSMAIDPSLISPNFHAPEFHDPTAEGVEAKPLPGWAFPEPTLWDRVSGWFRPPVWHKFPCPFHPSPPAVLSSGAESEPVLRELEREPILRPFVEQARKNAVLLRR